MAAAPQPGRGAAGWLVLASGSPQRREILTRLGLNFEVVVPDVEEVSGGDPEGDVLENARRKAETVAARLAASAESGIPQADTGARLIVACDTDVVLDGGILGKPGDESEAADYLRRLSGRVHEVISAVAVLESDFAGTPAQEKVTHAQGSTVGAMREGIERSKVRFRRLDEEEISWYVSTGEWRGRAGGYAIQGFGSALVAGVEGDLSNVIGLPVTVLVALVPEIFRS